MNYQFTPYSEGRESGLPWLGSIPAYWHLERAKWLFRRMQRPVRPEDEVVTCFRDGIVTLRRNRRVAGFTESLQEIGYQGVRRGDLVIHAMDAFAGAIGVSDSDGKSTPVYSVCSPTRDLDVNYYARVVREMARTQYIQSLARGIRERSTDFRYEMFANLLLPVPPVGEQRLIASFLDHADRRINRYIRAKRRLIELLNEQKQAIIHQAVTRGLDPNVRLKPSGVEWLGDIPEHWTVMPLRFLGTKFGSGSTPKGGATVYQATGVPFLRSQNIHFGELRLTDVAYIPEAVHFQMAGTHVRPRDVLLNITGASIGRVCSVPETFEAGNVNQHVCIIRPVQHRISSDFLAHFLSTPPIQNEIRVSQNGASREGLPLDELKALMIVVPPRQEQERIELAITDETTQVDRAIKAANREIDLIREYRTRLIADVVTGKLDVRGVELPELDEAEPLKEWSAEVSDDDEPDLGEVDE